MSIIFLKMISNYFFLMLSAFAYYFTAPYRERCGKKFYPIIICTFSILLCLLFSIEIEDGVYLDLRRIPFVLGILYHGFFAAVWLLPITAILRLIIIGEENILIFSVNFFLFSLIATLASKKFVQWSLLKKLSFASCIISISSLGSFFWYLKSFETLPFRDYFYSLVIPLVGIVSCISLTEKHLETERQQQEIIKLQNYESFSQVAASMSHQIRNPLASITLFFQLIRDDPHLQEKFSFYLNVIDSDIKDIDLTIQSYLLFTSQGEKQKNDILLSNVIDEALNEVKQFREQNNVDIIKDINQSEVYIINGDPERFLLLFINLFKSSLVSMPNGGFLKVSVESIGDQIIVKIRDNGPHFLIEQLERINEPLFLNNGRGSGIEFYLAVKLVEEFKGKLEISNNVEDGILIVIILPSKKAQ